MNRITVDPNFARQLQGVTTPTEFCDSSGQVLGRYVPQSAGDLPSIPRPELERRLKEESFTTDEVLEHLERQ